MHMHLLYYEYIDYDFIILCKEQRLWMKIANAQ